VIVVSNTSPVCYLTLIGCLDLLRDLFGGVRIPPAVHEELNDPGAPVKVREVAAALPPWLAVQPLRGEPEEALVALDRGEREAIALAEELNADLVLLDDAEARQMAADRGLSVMGLVGVLAAGATRGLVDVTQAVAGLQRTTFRASPQLLRSLLEPPEPPLA
jgi:predicted nucleic acid-binding protein